MPRKLYDVVSSRDGERVVIGLTNRRQAREEAQRLNGQVQGTVRRLANDERGDTFELPGHPTQLNAKVTVNGEQQDQHLRLRPATEYTVVERDVEG